MSQVISERIAESPRAVYLKCCEDGKLGYQVSVANGEPVFFPRVTQPGTGNTDLEWRESTGFGVVYATTTVRPRGESPHNVSMIELDEGFRMMSTVVGTEPELVAVGDRVQLTMQPLGVDGGPLPAFTIVEDAR